VLVRRSAHLVLVATAAAAATALAVPATAATHATSTASSHVGSTLHVVHDTTFNARTSGNWFGYVQGTLEKPGRPQFTSIAGTWVVPTATQHKANESENSSTWIGIGGGCINKNCLLTDNTLIQAGTEQDVDSSGVASYHAWYEVIPAPSIRTTLVVNAGNKIRATIGQIAPDLWRLTMRNLTTGGSWKATLPYSSTHLTAEWVDETPLTTAGFAALPNLTPTHFDDSLVNGVNAHLTAGERLYLTGGSGIIGAPSVPQADGNGFGDCAWATSCGVPGNF
jgi:hypothetical protein